MSRRQISTSIFTSFTKKNNIVWFQGISSAWEELKQSFHEKSIKIHESDDDEDLQKIISSFEGVLWEKQRFPTEGYYFKSGKGQKTITAINQQLLQFQPSLKNPLHSHSLLENEMILFSYLNKELEFEYPFEKSQVTFNGAKVDGFSAKSKFSKSQISKFYYKNKDNFLISLKTKNAQEQALILKAPQNLSVQGVKERISLVKEEGKVISSDDTFEMPYLKFESKRRIDNLLNKHIENKDNEGYFFGEIRDIVRFGFKEQQAKGEKEKQIKDLFVQFQPQRFILDKPFWIIIRKKGNKPYLILKIQNIQQQYGLKRQKAFCCVQ